MSGGPSIKTRNLPEFLKLLAEKLQPEEGSSLFNPETMSLTCHPEDLKHELLHVVLRHWSCCGRRVNGAADLALQPFLDEAEDLAAYGLPAGRPAEYYLRWFPTDADHVTLGTENFELSNILDELSERKYEDDESVRLSSVQKELRPDYHPEHFAASVRACGVTEKVSQMKRSDQFIALMAESFSLGLSEVNENWFDLASTPRKKFLLGSDDGRTITGRSLVVGALSRSVLRNCEILGQELVKCKLINCRVRCKKSINCVIDRTSEIVSESFSNLEIENVCNRF